MRKSTLIVFLIIAAVLVGIGVSLHGGEGGFTRWLASLHGTPRH